MTDELRAITPTPAASPAPDSALGDEADCPPHCCCCGPGEPCCDCGEKMPGFTAEQVRNLNAWQHGPVHPFTCGNEDCGEDLVATTRGWICPMCDYTQDWAHPFMLDGSTLRETEATLTALRQPAPRADDALREAAKPFVAHYESWMDNHADALEMSCFARVTYGQVRALRAALASDAPTDAAKGD